MVAPFIGLTGGTDLLNELLHTDPASMVLAVMVLWAVAIVPLGQLDDVVAARPLPVARPARPRHGQSAALES